MTRPDLTLDIVYYNDRDETLSNSGQGRIVRSRTLESSMVKVLRVEHLRVNLFNGQLKLFESCLVLLFKKKRRTTSSTSW